MNMEKNSVISNMSMLEYPFMRKGMTYEEYQEEWEYFVRHNEEYKRGDYKPLWKQREEADGFVSR